MDEVICVLLAVGRCVDTCCLLVDLVMRAVCWLLRFLYGVATSLHNTLVTLCGSTLVEYWNFALFSFLTASEAVSSATCGAVQVLEDWLQALGGVFESFKMVGHLSCHVAWRIKDVLHRGLISGSCILRQTCEVLCIALSLVLYFVNTVVNIVLISTQNCVSVLVGMWEVVADPVHKVVELALNLLTFLYSCLVGVSVLLWTPCQLLLDFLAALARVFCTVFMVDSHFLLIAVAVIALALLLLKHRAPELDRRPIRPRVNPRHTLQRSLATTEQEVSGPNIEHTDAFMPVTDPEPEPQAEQDGEPAGGSRTASPKPNSATDAELLSLLKEQEERKKCVICQDLSKTVLLLPCRHLCLCRHCADILTQHRNALQRCCPLCRQPIALTMDVFL